MRKSTILFVMAIMSLAFGLAQAEDTVYFADTNLKFAVEAALGISDPTPTEMLQLISLIADEIGIVDLTGLEYATNLEELSLLGNEISDISPLSALTKMDQLTLSENQISDISPLASLIKMTQLHLLDNQIVDISPVGGLLELRVLRLGNNHIVDISPVANLNKVWLLRLNGNQISDISPMEGMTSLSWVSLSGNKIIDISPLANLLELTSINLWGNRVVDISPLAGLVDLNRLILGMNNISDISPVANLHNLNILDLQWNLIITDISPVQGLLNLHELILWHNQITDISPLENLTELEVLGLNTNQLQDVTAIGNLANLKELHLANNKIIEIAALTELMNLQFLDLRANRLNTVAYTTHIPQIFENNPGIEFQYDGAYWHTLTISSTDGGSVIVPGEGQLQYVAGDIISIKATPESIEYKFTNWSGTAVAHGSVADPNSSDTWVTINADDTLKANFEKVPVLFVDVNADPNGDGGEANPFNSIQKAIDKADDGTLIVVQDGEYRESIHLCGKCTSIVGSWLVDPNSLSMPVFRGNGLGPVVICDHGEDTNTVLEGLIITGGKGEIAGGILCSGSSPTISHCLIVGNRATDPNGAAVYCVDSNAVFTNCIVSGNYGGVSGSGFYFEDCNAVLTNSIIWGNLSYEIFLCSGVDPNITYCDIFGGWPSSTNSENDPCFASPGYWADPNDPNIPLDPNDPNAIWIEGDYHLKSQAGRWDPISESWVCDDVTSPCIDAGDPNMPVGDEPEPNGGRINMGAYGGTVEASKSFLNVE